MATRNIWVAKAMVRKDPRERIEDQIDELVDDFIKSPFLKPTVRVMFLIHFRYFLESLSTLTVLQQLSAYVSSYHDVFGFLIFV